MTADLRSQLRSYGAFHDRAQAEVPLDDVIGAGSPVQPLLEPVPPRRLPGWVVAVAAFVVVAAVGATVLLLTSGGDTTGFIDEGTSVPASTTLPVTSVPSDGPSSMILTEVATDDPIETARGTIRFTTLATPEDRHLYPVGATRHGLVALEDEWLRWSTDGVNWEGTPVYGSWFTIDGDDLYVYGALGPVRYTWDGDGWVEAASSEGIGLVDDMAFGPQGTVAVRSSRGSTTAARSAFYYVSADGLDFSEASNPPSPERLPQRESSARCTDDPEPQDAIETFDRVLGSPPTARLLGINGGFLSLTSAHPQDWGRPICEPLLWFSSDGNDWQLVSTESPFGPDAGITDVVESAWTGRFVAVGDSGRPAAWWSDDGLAWHRIETDFSGDGTVWIQAVAAGPRGWVMIATAPGVEGAKATLWFSADGETWDGPYPGPDAYDPGFGYPSVAATDDLIFGVGSLHLYVPAIGRWQPEDH